MNPYRIGDTVIITDITNHVDGPGACTDMVKHIGKSGKIAHVYVWEGLTYPRYNLVINGAPSGWVWDHRWLENTFSDILSREEYERIKKLNHE